MKYSAGQYWLPYASQVAESLSCTTGYAMSSRAIASATLPASFSNGNSGVCTPTIVSPSLR